MKNSVKTYRSRRWTARGRGNRSAVCATLSGAASTARPRRPGNRQKKGKKKNIYKKNDQKPTKTKDERTDRNDPETARSANRVPRVDFFFWQFFGKMLAIAKRKRNEKERTAKKKVPREKPSANQGRPKVKALQGQGLFQGRGEGKTR